MGNTIEQQPVELPELDERAQATYDRYRDELASGDVFRTEASAHRTNRFCGYRGPTTAKAYGHVIKTLGELAGISDVYAQYAAQLLHGLPLYQTDTELAMHLMDNATTALSKGYDNVIECSGPEGGRRRTMPYSGWQAVTIALYLLEAKRHLHLGGGESRIGWCLRRMMTELRIPFYMVPDALRSQVDA